MEIVVVLWIARHRFRTELGSAVGLTVLFIPACKHVAAKSIDKITGMLCAHLHTTFVVSGITRCLWERRHLTEIRFTSDGICKFSWCSTFGSFSSFPTLGVVFPAVVYVIASEIEKTPSGAVSRVSTAATEHTVGKRKTDIIIVFLVTTDNDRAVFGLRGTLT